MVKNNKTCILCKKKYSYCSNCAEFDNLPYWMTCYCSKNCKEIFDTLSAYNMNQLTKEEAKFCLDKCDLSYKGNFNSLNQGFIDSIMTDKTSTFDVDNSVETIEPVPTAGQVTIIGEPIMNAPEPLPENAVVIEESTDKETVSDPIMGDTAIKQPKRMKYTKKK